MDDDFLIDMFFRHGCTGPDGSKLPLRNCEKIHKLYREEVDGTFCSGCAIRAIKKKYAQRLRIFLEKDRELKS